MRTVGFICLFVLASASPAAAEEPPPNVDLTAVDEMSAMIDNIQARIDKMNDAAGERDSTIEFLNRQIEQAIGTLTSRQDENLALRQKTSELTTELDFAAVARGELDAEVSRVTSDRDRIFAELDAQVQAFADLLALEQETTARLRKDLETRTAELQATLDEKEAFGQQLASLRKALAEEKEGGGQQLRELDGSRREIASLGEAQTRLESALADLQARQKETDLELVAARDRNGALEKELAGYLSTERDVERLNRQLAEVNQQIAVLNAALESSESKNQTQQSTIADLGKRLNIALAAKVQELARYRSDFFGRLRDVLGSRGDIRIVGDRFVFQSEVLFGSGEAEIESAGRQKLLRLAESLNEVAVKIPSDVDWVLRVDGHTDERPIRSPQFPSNWELSTARATAVVKFLIDQDIPANRLIAAGFAQYHPLDLGKDEISFRRNRRIEFKLTQR
jgi:chemotaxis protein MotB